MNWAVVAILAFTVIAFFGAAFLLVRDERRSGRREEASMRTNHGGKLPRSPERRKKGW